MYRAIGVAFAVTAACVLAGCKSTADPKPGAATDNLQGWDVKARDAWYNGTQGSRLMPLTWFQNLEQPAGAPGGKFLDATYLATFRILPPSSTGALPVGFAVDDQDDSKLNHTNLHWLGKPADKDRVKWVGLNCSACHTGQMTYGDGPPITIQGAPSLFDFQSFIRAVDKALVETRDDPARWDKFAKAVLAADDNADTRKDLLAALNKLIAWEAAAERLNNPAGEPVKDYGFARVDAVGHIYNRTLLFAGATQPIPNPADAPVSYPHLWNIAKQTHVQWDGIATNTPLKIGQTPTDFGALGRNTGEVLGVFGEAIIKPKSSAVDLSGFDSSVNVVSLNSMEVLVAKLKPPEWPKAFPAAGAGVKGADGKDIAPEAVLKAGKEVFAANCASCHTPHKTYETVLTFAQLGDNQTDEWMACNAWAFKGLSGQYAGIPANYVTGDKLTAAEPVRALLTTAVKGVLVNRKLDLAKITAQNVFGTTPLPRVNLPQRAGERPLTRKEQQLAYCRANAGDPLMAYKARPLEGIWATAPYLHNGSVPTLADLLLPVAERPATFALGTRQFDPQKVGYSTDAAAPGNTFTFDTSQPGNSNKGHVYGVDKLTPLQRQQLLEYLKVIPEPQS